MAWAPIGQNRRESYKSCGPCDRYDQWPHPGVWWRWDRSAGDIRYRQHGLQMADHQ